MITTDENFTNSRRGHESRFHKALFAFHRGDYRIAVKEFERVIRDSERLGQTERTLESCSYVMRILAEREDFARIDKIEVKVKEILKFADAGSVIVSPALKARALYVLGICSVYRGSRYDVAKGYFNDSIDWALLAENKENLAPALYGTATVLYAQNQYPEAIRELDRLDVLLSCLSLPDLASASHLLRAMIQRNLGALDDALEAAWRAFDTLKHHPHLVLYLHTLCVLGTIFSLKGDDHSARLYLDLADRSLKRDELPRIARLVDEAVSKIDRQLAQSIGADLVFDTKTGVLIERHKGEIHFDGQFILRDLLRVFLEEPGRIFSKEELVRRVWHEDYNARVHDNKIYVTIKRLRKLLEPETDSASSLETKPDYILRAKNGYFLNAKTRVLINETKPASSSQAVASVRIQFNEPIVQEGKSI